MRALAEGNSTLATGLIVQEANPPNTEPPCKTYCDAWVWITFALIWPMAMAFVVGRRIQENATLLLQRVEAVSDQRIPLFTSE